MSGVVIGKAVIEVGADATQFTKDLPKQTEPAAKQAGINMAGVLGKALGAGAAIVGGSVSGIIGVALAKGFSRLTAIDDAQAKLKGLGYSATQVTAVMNSALASVKGTAFGLGDAASQAANLVAAGIKPGAELTRTLKLLADTSTIAGTSLGEVGAIFGKVAANGKVTNEVIGQLQDRGVPVLQFLAKQTGLSMGEVIKAVSAGKINFETFQKAMEKGLGGAALASGNTFRGAMANVGAALGRLGANVLGGVFSKLPNLISQTTGALDALAPISKKIGAAIGDAFSKTVTNVMDFVSGLTLTKEGVEGIGVPLEGLVATGRTVRVVFDVLVTTLTALWTAGTKVLGYMKEHQKLSESLAISMGLLLAVTQAHATFLAVQAVGGLAAYIAQLNIVVTITKVWAAVQWVLNAALDANPIGLAVIAIAALVAAVILAYQNSETFRNIVNAAWAAVKSAIGVVVNWITGTVVPWLVSAWNVISSGATALWGYVQIAWNGIQASAQVVAAWITGTLVPNITAAWNLISGGAQILWDATVTIWNGIKTALSAVGDWINNTFGPSFRTLSATVEFVFKAIEILILAWWKLIIIPTFNAVMTLLVQLGGFFTMLWTNYVVPAWNGIQSAILTSWNVIQGIWNAMVAAGVVVGLKMLELWNVYVVPAWNGIELAIRTAWGIIQGIWNSIITAIGVLGGWFSDLYTKYVKPAWDSVSAVIASGWQKIQPIFDALKTGVGLIKDAFDKAVAGISTAWNKIQDVTKAPIKFVIETVLNNGLIKAFNTLGSAVGGPHIDNIPLPFAAGGVLPGYTPGRDVHQFYSPTGGRLALSGGEAIMRPEFTRAVGGKRGVDRLNAAAVRGFADGGVVGFADGGVLDFIKNAGATAFSWVGDKASTIWNAFQDPLAYFKSLMPSVPGAGAVTQYAQGAANKLLTAAVEKIKSLFKAFTDAFSQPTAAIGGGATQWSGTVLQALNMLGLPASLLNTVLAQITTESGGNPNAVQGNIGDINNVTGNLARGLMQVIPPTFAAYHVGGTSSNIFDPLANIAAGLNYASSRYGGAAGIASILGHGHGYAAGGVFRPLLFDKGGVLPKGLSLVQNNTGAPEALSPTDVMGSGNINLYLSIEDLEKIKTIEDFVKMLENARTKARKTQRSGRVNA